MERTFPKEKTGWIIMYNYEKIKNLIEWLSSFVNRGISIFLMGKPVTPAQAAEAVVGMDGSFMADFVHDEDGFLTEIRYDKVRFA